MHRLPKRRLASNNGARGKVRGGSGGRLVPQRWAGSLLALADEDGDAAQGGADRHHRALEPEQQQGLGADEGVGDQGGELLGGEGPEGAEAALGLAGHLGQEHVPVGEQFADRVADLGVGPAGGQHLLEHAHVARLQVVLQKVAGLLVALPERLVLGVHAGLALQQAVVLLGEQGDDERALGAEVVVELAQRHPRLLGHLAGGEAGVAVGQQAAPGGLDDARAGIGRHVHHGCSFLVDTTPESVVRPILTYLTECYTLPPVRSTDRERSRSMQQVDPTFYRTPGEAVAAPPERLAYVAAFDPAGRSKDAMTVLDCDPSSSDYGRVV